MGKGHLRVEVADSVLRVTLDRPAKRNAISRPLLDELRRTFESRGADGTLRLAVLTGAGDKSFAAGGDLKDLSAVRTIDEAAEMARQAKAALDAIRRFPVPVIAALNGDAIGGGAELALACDFRVAAPQARIGFLQGRVNISTAWGGGIDLFGLLGPSQGLALLCSGDLVGGERALAIGLMDAVAPEGESLERAVESFAAPMLRQAPQVLRAFKRLAIETRDGRPRAELDALETRIFSHTWAHQDHWDAVDRIFSA